jgi:hypothetical protein
MPLLARGVSVLGRFLSEINLPSDSHAYILIYRERLKRMARLIFFLARLFALGCGWLAAGVTALLSGFLLGVPILPVFLASGFLWTCLLLLD